MEQQSHIQKHRKMMQQQKHQQVKYYNQSARDLPSHMTGDAVHVKLVPNTRRWTPGTIVEILGARTYRVKTVKGGTYIWNRKFFKIRHKDYGQSPQTAQKSPTPSENTTHTSRPKRLTRRPQRLIKSMNFIWAKNTQGRFK